MKAARCVCFECLEWANPNANLDELDFNGFVDFQSRPELDARLAVPGLIALHKQPPRRVADLARGRPFASLKIEYELPSGEHLNLRAACVRAMQPLCVE